MKPTYALLILWLSFIIALPLPVWFFDQFLYAYAPLKLLLEAGDYFYGFTLIEKFTYSFYLLFYAGLTYYLSKLYYYDLLPENNKLRTSLTGITVLLLLFLTSSVACYSLFNGSRVTFLTLY